MTGSCRAVRISSGRLTFGRPPLHMAPARGVEEDAANANRRTLTCLSGYADNQGLDQAAAPRRNSQPANERNTPEGMTIRGL